MFPQKFILFILGLIAPGLLTAEPNADILESDSGEFWEEVYKRLSIGDMPLDYEYQPTVKAREMIA